MEIINYWAILLQYTVKIISYKITYGIKMTGENTEDKGKYT